MVKEHNILMAGPDFIQACQRLAVFVNKQNYKPNVRPGEKPGYYLVSKVSAPEQDETVFFFGIFRTGVYGFCTCLTCQEKETVCTHLVSALPKYLDGRGAKSCKLCNQIRLPNDLHTSQICIVCLMEQNHAESNTSSHA